MTDPKMLAALEAYRRRLNAQRGSREQLSPKNIDALLEVQDRYLVERNLLSHDERTLPITCEFKPDRIVGTTATHPGPELEKSGYVKVSRNPLWGQIYRFVDRFQGDGSIREIVVEYDPTVRWSAPCRTTLLPRDPTGCLARDLQPIHRRIPDFEPMLVELALDFPLNSIMDVGYVRAHLVSGKMRLRTGSDSFYDRFRGASRTIRPYVKWEIAKFRLESELHSRVLRKHGVKDLLGIRHVVEQLVPKYLVFAELDRAKVDARIRQQGKSAQRLREINHALDIRSNNLSDSLLYLRTEVGLKNTRRLLSLLNEINSVIADAAGEWATTMARSEQMYSESNRGTEGLGRTMSDSAEPMCEEN